MDQTWGAANAGVVPLPLTSLVGREQDVAQVTALLQSGQTRLLTLTGPGGVGKTRLALQVAASLHGSFRNGAYFVSLAPVSNSDLVLSTIAQTLGVREVGREPTLDSLCSALRDRHLLITLDNFEQVVSAGQRVLDLLQCAPHLQVLVTSRTVLRVYGEQEYEVLPLAIPDASQRESPEQLAKYEAVRLFIERARAVKPGFTVTNGSAIAIAEICRRLDGLPLAIELAAARIKLMSPQALLKRLDPRLPLLTRGATTLPYRHQTLRDAIAWSYDLLAEDEARLFRWLSVFLGGCTLEAAEAVCVPMMGDGSGLRAPSYEPGPNRQLAARSPEPAAIQPSLLDGLAALVDKSLVRQEEQEDGEPRFHMLETIREFALESLTDSGEEALVRERHAMFFLELAERAEPELLGANQALWLDILAQEHDNLRATLLWEEHSGEAERGLQLAAAMRTFWRMRGYLSEGRKWLTEALERAKDAQAATRAKALNGLGNLAFMQGDLSSARDYYEQDLALGQELGDKMGVARSLLNLGNIARVQGDFAGSKTLYQQSLDIYRELGQQWGTANALHNLSVVSWDLNDYENARTLGHEALLLRRELGEKAGIASVLTSLGEYALTEGDHTAARAFLEECLGLCRELGDNIGTARALSVLGDVSAGQGDYYTARELQTDSLRLRHEVGSKRGIIQCLESLAAVARAQGEPRRVVILLAAAGTLRSAIGAAVTTQDFARNEQSLEFARTKLRPDAFASAWEEGKALSLEEVVALALEVPAALILPEVAGASSAPSTERGVSTPWSDLTPREIEVLRLVAAGLTNPDIAEHLSLSIYTVQTHLRSIFSKINVSTRSAAVRFVFEHNLGQSVVAA